MPARHRRALRRVPAPAQGPAVAAAARPARGRGATSARSADGCSTCSSGADRRRPAHRRRIRLRHGRPARAAARRDDAGHPPAPRRRRRCSTRRRRAAPADRTRAGRGADPGRPVQHGHLDRAVGARQRAAGARGRPAGVLDRRGPGHQRRVRGVHRGRRLRRPALVDARPAGTTGRRPGWPRRSSGAATAAAGGAPPVRPRRAGAAGRAGAARVLVRGRRLRAVGRQAAADRGRVGEGGPLGPGDRPVPALPLGRRRPDRRARQPRPARTCGPAAVGAYPAGASPLGRAPADRRRVGVDGQRLHRLPGLRGLCPYREYSEVFFGADYKVLRGGSWATDPAACRGTFRNWDYPIRRQIFAGFRCARDAATRGQGSADLMCRHLAYLGPPGAAGRLVHRPAALAGAPVLGAARPARTARSTPTASASAGTPTAGPGPARYRRGGPIWADPSFRPTGQGGPLRRGAGRGPVGHRRAWPRARRRRCAPLRARGAGCSATTAPSPAGPTSSASWPAGLPAPTCCALEALTDSALLWALVGTAAAGRAQPRPRRSRQCVELAASTAGGRSTCCSPTAADRRDGVGRHAVAGGRRGRAVRGRLRAVRRRARWSGAGPLAGLASPDGVEIDPLADRRTAHDRSRTRDRVAATTARSHLPPDFLAAACAPTCRRGLTATPKSLPPKWFYDERGSALFEEITRLPEYYPTRAERAILARARGRDRRGHRRRTLVELGSGSSREDPAAARRAAGRRHAGDAMCRST